MTQNRSSAVMQQRSEPDDSLDDFPTPPWATRALCAWLLTQGYDLSGQSCREPAANRGHMVKPLQEYFAAVHASDVHDYGFRGADFRVLDYLFPGDLPKTDWTISNPPFRLAEDFIKRALDLSRFGVAMIVRSAFLEGQERYANLFATEPPSAVLQFSERCGMFKGKLRRLGDEYVDREGVTRKAATATAYCWLVWTRGESDTRLRWIPPCRQRLERPSDYPQDVGEARACPLFESEAA